MESCVLPGMAHIFGSYLGVAKETERFLLQICRPSGDKHR
jgi:hypothetical protein